MALYLMCPNCGGFFHMTVGPLPVIIGPGTRTCGSCKAVFKDGSVEWSDATGWQKFNFLVPLGYKVFGALILAIPFLSQGGDGPQTLSQDLSAVVKLLAIAWIPYGLFCAHQIFQSRRRRPK